MEEKLIALLQNAGREDLAIALERDEEFDDFIVKHRDELKKIPGFVDLMQPASISAPHGLSKEEAKEYFSDVNGNVDKTSYDEYFKQEEKYNTERAKKQQLADEYKRSKESNYFNTFLANEYAKQQAIKGNNGNALANEVAAKLGFATDFLPYPVSMLGPVIRLNQKTWNEPDKITDASTWRDLVLDLGTSVLGPAKGYAKAGYESIKRSAGPALGKLFDSERAKALERGIEALDAAEAAKIAAARRNAVMNKTDEFKTMFDKGKYSDKQALDYADEIETEYPELAKTLREHVNALAANRKAATEAELAKTVKAKNAAEKQAEAVVTSNKLADAKKKAQIELFEAQDDATKAAMQNYVLLDEADNLVAPVHDIDKQYKAYKTIKNAKTTPAKLIMAGSKPAIKASMSIYDDKNDYDKYEKEYSSAIEYIIQSNKRQWKAGFAPRGGIELEAYNIAKDRGEI